jgi:uncharacterized protein (TIGR01777 family)
MSTDLVVERHTTLPVPPEAAFAWHARPGALERLAPPWRAVQVLERPNGLVNGSRARLRFRLGGILRNCLLEYREVEPGRGYTEVQLDGPFGRWEHVHRFEPGPGDRTEHFERIVCRLAAGMVFPDAGRRELRRLLAYRQRVAADDLAMHADAGGKRLHVGITGGSGFIGSLLIPVLTTGGHRVSRFVRRAAAPGEVEWDPDRGELDPARLKGMHAIIHLAGENLAVRWTAARKRAIRESRERGTALIAQAMAQASQGPRILISASAIGYYGDRGDETLSEASAPGTGFLPEVVVAWEAAARTAEAAGVRVVRLRIGLPLHPRGGLLARMLPPFRLGLGGRLGRGRQWMSWIGADDLLAAFHHALVRDDLRGAVNATAPNPERNAELTRALARVLGRPAPFRVPPALLELRFGELATEVLASARVLPEALIRSGFRFRHPELADALGHLLGRET